MLKMPDKTGDRYGRLVVKSCFTKDGRTHWLCLCDCGKEVVCHARDIKYGKTKSCGCLRKELVSARRKIHGEADNTQTYKAWRGIKARCYNPNLPDYASYGGRGITMSPLWKDDYTAFRDYIGPPPDDGQKYTVDRIDPNGNYEPGNVRWATRKQQARNRGIVEANTTGVNGVSFNCKCYRAKWVTLEGKQKSKSFNISKYGKEEAFRLACEARENAIKELNAQGAGYTENHGK